MMLAVQWAWAALVYHATFFSSINPAAWLFAGLFLTQSALFAWFGVVRERLRFSSTGSRRHIAAWMLIIYTLIYPVVVQVEGHRFPEAPTFGVPCPTTLLTIGLLFAADSAVAASGRIDSCAVGIHRRFGGHSVAGHADLMLWAAGVGLIAYSSGETFQRSCGNHASCREGTSRRDGACPKTPGVEEARAVAAAGGLNAMLRPSQRPRSRGSLHVEPLTVLGIAQTTFAISFTAPMTVPSRHLPSSRRHRRHAGPVTVLVLGVANLLADGLSIGVGNSGDRRTNAYVKRSSFQNRRHFRSDMVLPRSSPS